MPESQHVPPEACGYCEYGHLIEVSGTRLCDSCGREVTDDA